MADIANATTAPNSGNKVYGNNISNINLGIVFVGSRISANQDNGNDVGGSSAVQGNIITNFSGGTATGTAFPSVSATILGIYFNHQRSANISNNSITSAVVTANTTMRGIAMDFVVAAPLGTFTNNITNNTITLRELGASATAFSMQGMLLANN